MRVLFVCLGNICRSPLAEAIARRQAEEMGVADRFHFASAGTGDWHVGCGADPRSAATAQRFGLDLSHHRAQQITAAEIADWDWLIAMDRANRQQLLAMGAPPERVWMMRRFEAPDGNGMEDVPDPYYGGPEGFVLMYRLLRDNAHAIIEALLAQAR
ncbi:MAG: low molecular weight phosphotyrosine protein phosphatase [Zetaproteobacteria bacterium]|nr:MAG: low molecular weight phosphotyrosine protein phosphatase [Zetaproteobacteria bacterium]